MNDKVISQEICLAILDSINYPVVFVDNEHVIRFVNKFAKKRYYEERGYPELLGKSLFDCHKPESAKKIRELYSRLQKGEDEIYNWTNSRGEKITIVAVRDEEENLLGYYERSEKVGNTEENKQT